jgi:hypothetical protein
MGFRSSSGRRAPSRHLAESQPQVLIIAPRFEAELRDALARASDDLDVSRVDEVLSRWHSRAAIVANPLTSEEQAVVRRARAGDLSGLRARDEHGGWGTV